MHVSSVFLKVRSCNVLFYTKIQNIYVTDVLRHSLFSLSKMMIMRITPLLQESGPTQPTEIILEIRIDMGGSAEGH